MTPDSHTIKSNTVYHMCCKQKYFKTGIYVLSYWASISIFTRYSSGMKTPFWTPEMSQNFISSINQSINQNIHLFYSSKHSNYCAEPLLL